jgi:hypothetical protein
MPTLVKKSTDVGHHPVDKLGSLLYITDLRLLQSLAETALFVKLPCLQVRLPVFLNVLQATVTRIS